MRQNFILFTAFLLFLQIGCGNQTARNRNAQIVANYNKAIINNANLGNANVNNNENLSNEEVPTFTDAQEALKKGDEFLDANLVAKAIDAFKQAIELDPDFALAHLQLGVAYDVKEKADQLKPITGDVSDSKKKKSVKSLEKAAKAFKKIVRKNPKDDVAFFNLGRAYTKLFDDIESEKAFQRAVKLKPEEGNYQTELGGALIKLAKYSAAIKALNKALKIDENNFLAEDLLKRAKAGRRRVGFKSKPKKRPTSKPRKKTTEKPTEKPKEKPVKKPVDKPKT